MSLRPMTGAASISAVSSAAVGPTTTLRSPISASSGVVLGAPPVQTTSGSSFIGGIEGGDRYQFGKLVIGWEGDIAWGDTGGTSTTAFGPGA